MLQLLLRARYDIPAIQDNSTVSCVDLNSTLSWTLPPDLLVDIDLEDMVEGEVSTAVAGASVTVGWEEAQGRTLSQ